VERRIVTRQFSLRSSFKLLLPMLLTILPSAGPIVFRHSARVYTPLLMTAAASASRRRMATTSGGAPVNPDQLSSKGTKEPLHQGVEGLHISTYTAFWFVMSDIERVLNNDAEDVLPPPSTTPEIKGDWVLFHPVYSPEELKAVEVSRVSHGGSLAGPINCTGLD
jgi:hypothetical protein